MPFENMMAGSAVRKEAPQKEKLTSTEVEAQLFVEYVAQALDKGGATKIAEGVRNGKINVEMPKRNAIELGKLAERASESKGEDFDSTGFLLEKANKVAEGLMEKQPEIKQ